MHGKVISPYPRIQTSLEGEGQGRGAKRVPAAALSAGCPHRPPTPRRRVSAAFGATRSARCSGACRRVALPSLPRGSRARGVRVAPLPRSRASLRVFPDGSWTGPGRPGPLAPGLRSPGYVPVPAFSLGGLTPLRSPAREPAPPAGPPPPSPARPLPRTLGQTWGGLSRAIGLGRCSDPALRIPPGFGGPLGGPTREGPGQRLTFDPTHHSRIPQVPLHPSPGAQGFETVVTPQRKRVRTSLRVEHVSQMSVCGVSRRFWVFVPGERALWEQKR